MEAEAKHFDAEKIPLDSLPFEAICHVGRIIRFGEKKYGRNNWTKGMPWNKLLGSTLRHIFAWASGEDKDKESGESHLAHACTDLLFLITYQLEGLGEDNRRKVNAETVGDECQPQLAVTAPIVLLKDTL
jgi:hypothetical protein